MLHFTLRAKIVQQKHIAERDPDLGRQGSSVQWAMGSRCGLPGQRVKTHFCSPKN